MTLAIQRGRQGLTTELLNATGGCELSRRPTDLCREWPCMGTRTLWLLLRGWAPLWLLIIAGPCAHLAGKDRHWYWVHSSLSESSSFWVSSRLAERKESCHTLVGPWLGRCWILGMGQKHGKGLCCYGKLVGELLRLSYRFKSWLYYLLVMWLRALT
jgi:hypothetical protein